MSEGMKNKPTKKVLRRGLRDSSFRSQNTDRLERLRRESAANPIFDYSKGKEKSPQVKMYKVMKNGHLR